MGLNQSKSEHSKSSQQRIMDQLYLDKDETGDVTFIVESKNIGAHKSVLAAVSPKYKAQFYGLQPDHGEVIISDVTAAAFEVFLRFFYLDDVRDEMTTENIEELLSLAKQSLLQKFVELCTSFIFIKAEVPLAYRVATLYDIEELEELCLLRISEDPMSVFKSDDFAAECNRDMLIKILKMNLLACTETELFDFCISWAKAACEQKNIDADRLDNLRGELGDVIYEIRFRSMTFEEFANLHRTYEGFFTPNESIELMYMFGNVKDLKTIKFNQTLRNEPLQLSRIILEEPIDEWRITIAPVTFSCDKPIHLKGFAAPVQFTTNQYKLQINVTDDKGHCEEHRPEYTIQQKLDMNRYETIVTLEKLIGIKPNDCVQVSMELPIYDSCTKYTLAQVMNLGDIKFTFNTEEEASPGILLTKLFYYPNHPFLEIKSLINAFA